MLVVAYIPLLVCIIGLLIFMLSTKNPKVTKVGEIMFWTGLLVTLATWASHVAHIGS